MAPDLILLTALLMGIGALLYTSVGHAGASAYLAIMALVGFAPETIFCLVRWAANEHGTIISRVDIVRAVDRGEPFQTLPFVRPGGDILLRLDGWPKVQRALAAIDAVEALGLDPADASPDHWRHVHNRLSAGLEPSAYTPERHAAWTGRRRIDP